MRLHSLILLMAALPLMACGDDDGPTTGDSDVASDTMEADTSPPLVLSFCDGTTTFAYDPLNADDWVALPDDAWTVIDATTPTGIRVDIDEDTPWMAGLSSFVQPIYLGLGELDGWGTSAGIVLQVDAPLGDLPSGDEDSLTSSGLMLVRVDDGSGQRIPFEAEVFDGGRGVVLWPMFPLEPKAQYAALLTTAHVAADGDCVAPSQTLQSLLAGDEDALRASGMDALVDRGLIERYRDVMAVTGLRPDSVSAATVFTTQAIHDASIAARDDIEGSDFGWTAPPTCGPDGAWTRCRGTFTATDYRIEGYLGANVPTSEYELPVTIWLPDGDGPFPTVLYGHGLGGSSNERFVANALAPLGMAVVAISQPRHGDHPTANTADPNAFFLDLLGLDINALTIDPFVFRENLRQASLDKLQLVKLLRAAPDVTGNGSPDLDTTGFGYFGVSLGGIMASDFLMLSDAVEASVLAVAGGRLISIITEGEDFSAFLQILENLAGGKAEVTRLAPIAQAIIDAGDPVNYAPHVLKDRIAGEPPHLLQMMAVGDTVVPNVTSRALARALDIPHLSPVSQDVGVIDVLDRGEAQGNLDDGTTAGLYQLDRISFTTGPPQPASHQNVFSGREGPAMMYYFVETWAADYVPIIIDPYGDFGTPELP